MQRVGLVFYQIFKYLSLIGLVVAAYIANKAPIEKLITFMVFVSPAIVLYLLARIIRRLCVGPVTEKTSPQLAPPPKLNSVFSHLLD